MESARNIYKTSREHAGLTQEAAAGYMGIAVETLRAYETGGRRPADDMVSAMVTLYDDQYLGYLHMQSSPLSDCIPRVRLQGIQQAAMRIVRLVKRFARDQRVDQLLEIAEDGVIDEEELPVFQEIMSELRAIVESVLALGFCGHEKAPDRTAMQSGVGR